MSLYALLLLAESLSLSISLHLSLHALLLLAESLSLSVSLCLHVSLYALMLVAESLCLSLSASRSGSKRQGDTWLLQPFCSLSIALRGERQLKQQETQRDRERPEGDTKRQRDWETGDRLS